MREGNINSRYNTREKQHVPSTIDYKRGERARGGVDGYRHRECALRKVPKWIDSSRNKE